MIPMPRNKGEKPSFFDEKVAAAIAGKSADQALADLAALIHDGMIAKEAGSGPPEQELNRARRKWLDIYETLYSGKIAA